MNSKKLLFGCIATLGLSAMTFGQSFEHVMHTPGVDHNHYSIDMMPDGGYAIAGTQFNGGNQDIHIAVFDPNGNVQWERTIDVSSDDRALDVVIGDACAITVTGYVSSGTKQELYVVSYDGGGTFMWDRKLDYNALPDKASAGTNIVWNPNTATYIVGGLMADLMAYPLNPDNSALVWELDAGGAPTGNINTFASAYKEHTSINDIAILPGDHYFITGSVGLAGGMAGQQGVLAAKLDPNLGLMNNVSLESTNDRHCGVSLVYDEGQDKIYMMSNNSVIHNPQITEISDIMGVPVITNNYYLEIDPTYGSYNAAGFHMQQDPWNPGALVAMGYHRTDWVNAPAVNNDATLWIANFEKATGNNISGLVWPAPSANFYNHGGNLFSTFVSVHPYVFNQEIFCLRFDQNGFTFISPNDMTGDYAVELATTNFVQMGSCFEPLDYQPINIAYVPVNVGDMGPPMFHSVPNYTDATYTSDQDFYCTPDPCFIINGYTVGCDQIAELVRDENAALGMEDVDTDALSASPNPFKENLMIGLEGVSLNGELTITNAVGQVVYRLNAFNGTQIIIDTDAYESGIYMLKYTYGNKSMVKKLIKM